MNPNVSVESLTRMHALLTLCTERNSISVKVFVGTRTCRNRLDIHNWPDPCLKNVVTPTHTPKYMLDMYISI